MQERTREQYIKNDRIESRNSRYPKEVNVKNTGKFRITEVISDGRCLFGSIWLLSRDDADISRYMSDPNYAELEKFISNNLNDFIREMIDLDKLTMCQKLELMHLYYADQVNPSNESMIFNGAMVEYDVVQKLYCENEEVEQTNQESLLIIFEKLRQSDVLKSFQTMLKSYYTLTLKDGIAAYAEADLSFFGNILSDRLGLEIHIVRSKPNYLPPYAVDPNVIFRGRQHLAKRKIYLYFKQSDDGQSGHFQAMIPMTILTNSPTVSSTPEESGAVASTKSNLEKLTEMGFSKKKAEEALGQASNEIDFALDILNDGSNRGTSRVSSFDSADPTNYDDFNNNNKDELDRVNGEKDVCLAEKKSLFEYFTFPKKLKIKYVSASNNSPTDLPSTGFFGSIKGAASTTDRIRGEESDNVYSKVAKKFTNTIQKVEISNGRSIENPSTNYMKATEDWYFLVTLEGNPVPVTRGGRTQKRQQKRGGRRRSSQKKRKTHFRRRLTKRR